MTSKNVKRLEEMVGNGEVDSSDLLKLVELKEISADMYVEILWEGNGNEDEDDE
jgi:hypothetical protein